MKICKNHPELVYSGEIWKNFFLVKAIFYIFFELKLTIRIDFGRFSPHCVLWHPKNRSNFKKRHLLNFLSELCCRRQQRWGFFCLWVDVRVAWGKNLMDDISSSRGHGRTVIVVERRGTLSAQKLRWIVSQVVGNWQIYGFK